jgi:serine/threonine protein phosphatase PrpC
MLTLLRGSEKRTATMPGKEFDRILEAFEEPLQQKVIRGGFVGIKNYKPEIVKLWLHYTSSSPAYASLKAAARAEDEFHTLLDFLGIVAPKAHGRIEENCGMTKAKNLAPPERKNEDSMSSSRIALPDGTIIVLDAVWDGMGGHDDGSLASGIAKEIFEISSLAGWIKEPEDVRKLMILTDLAIIFEQISRAYKPEDPNLHDPLVIGNLRQQNSMGTTAVLCFQRGTELYVVNCGDSDFRLFASDVDYRHVVHDGSYDVRVQLQEDKELRALEDELRKNGRDPDKMDIYSRVALKEKARHLAEKKLSKDTEPPVSNVISAGLGGLAKYIHINGTTQWSKPVKVNGSAVKMLASDGVSDIVCHHESETLIMQSNGDLDLALKRIMALADHRSVDGAIFRLTCGCPDRQGKDDDKSLKLRFARAAS